MANLIVLITRTLGTLGSIALKPIVPAVALVILHYAPRDIASHYSGALIFPRSLSVWAKQSTYLQTPLRILLALGLTRLVNQTANSWALNNRRFMSHPGWRWSDEIVVVTGGCSGIGKAMVLGLAQKGITVVILDISELSEDLKAIKAVKYWKCDISSAAAVRKAADDIRATVGHPSILINNAGIANPRPILDTSSDALQKIFGVNLLSLWSTTQEFLPDMIHRNKGHIVTIASTASYVVMSTLAPYSATKAGALAFHEGLACEIRSHYKASGVLTTVVHPSWTATNMTNLHADKIEGSSGPMMRPEDVAARVLQQIFSCRGGQLFVPDGGGLLSGVRALPNWLQQILRSSEGL